MGIVVNIGQTGLVDVHVEPSPDTLECADALPDAFRSHSVKQADGSGGDAVLHVDPTRNSGSDAADPALRMDQVKGVVPQLILCDVLGVEIS